MVKSIYNLLAMQILNTVEAIKDPVEKAKAIGKFMEILKDKDVDCDCIDCENCPRDCKVEKDPTVEFSFDKEKTKMTLDEIVDSICGTLFGKVNSNTDKDKKYYSVNGKEVSEREYEKAKSEFDKKWNDLKKDFSIDSVLDKLYKD